MKFIVVHDLQGKRIVINASEIQHVANRAKTTIYFREHHETNFLEVRETFEEVCSLLSS